MNRPFPLLTAPFRTVLIWLILVDLALIALNIAAFFMQSADVISAVPEMLKVTTDRALPEDFNYAKWAVIVIALLWIALRDRWLPALIWSLVFSMILTDDSFQVHEYLGAWISDDLRLQTTLFLFGSDLGEIMVFVAMGLIAVILTVLLLTRHGQASATVSVRYFAILIALGFFGVGIDAVHQVISHFLDGASGGKLVSGVLGLAEDGGEMIVASFAAALTLAPPAETVFDRLVTRKVTGPEPDRSRT